MNEGLLEGGGGHFFYEIKRFDIKGKECLLGFRNRDSGRAMENVVYFKLLRRGAAQSRAFSTFFQETRASRNGAAHWKPPYSVQKRKKNSLTGRK